MKARFCDKTSDIHLILTCEEISDLQRKRDYTPCLDAEDMGFTFHLMNSNNSRGIDVREPKTLDYKHYWIKINDAMYNTLRIDGEIGDRYGGAYRIRIFEEQKYGAFS